MRKGGRRIMSRDLLIVREKEVKFLSVQEEVAGYKAESNPTASVGVVKEVIWLFAATCTSLALTLSVCLLSEKLQTTFKFKTRLQLCCK